MKTLLAAFHSVEDCSQTVSDVIAAGIMPAALEFMDDKTIEAVEASVYKAGYPLDARAALLIEVDGFREGLEETSDAIVEICRRNQAYEVRVAKNDEERAKLWLGRKGAFGAMGRISPDMIVDGCRHSEDAACPTCSSEIYRIVGSLRPRRRERVSRRRRQSASADPFRQPAAGPGGQDPRNGRRHHEDLRRCRRLAQRRARHRVEKKEFMDLVFSEADLDAMMQVKNVFNPTWTSESFKDFSHATRRCTEIGKHTTTSTAEIGKRVEAVLLRGNGDR